jgi:hypothetical protein
MTFFGGKGLKGGSGMKGLMPGALEGMNHEGMLPEPFKQGMVNLTSTQTGGGRRRRRRGTKRSGSKRRGTTKRRGSKRRGTTKRRKTHKRKH